MKQNLTVLALFLGSLSNATASRDLDNATLTEIHDDAV